MSATNTTPSRPAPPTGPLLSQLSGMAEARAWGESLLLALTEYYAGRIQWSDVDPGCVLHGPPGTGKTTFAKALAASAKLPLIIATFGEWQASGAGHLGTLTDAMRVTFAHARSISPCILFIDELDSIPARSSDPQMARYWNQFTNAILKSLDEVAEAKGVIVIGACNHPNMLDAALVRAGRMDRMIAVTLPNPAEIEAILKFHMTKAEQEAVAGRPASGGFRAIALLCTGMSGAEIAKAVREAKAHARANRHALAFSDFAAVLDPPEKRLNADYQWRVAVHETGHAVAGYRLGVASAINLSIVAASGREGCVRFTEYERPLTRKTIEDTIVVLMAGRAAEQVFLREVSGGAGGPAHSDLAMATKFAIKAVARLGLSESDTLFWHGQPEDTPLSQYPAAVVAEVDSMLSKAYDEAVRLIEHDWDFANNVALALIKRRALSHTEFVLIDRRPRETHRDYRGGAGAQSATPHQADPFADWLARRSQK